MMQKKYDPDKAVWTEACQKSFNQIKEALSKGPVLTGLDFNKTFKMSMNASDTD